VHQVGYLQRLYQDARSTEHKKLKFSCGEYNTKLISYFSQHHILVQ